MISGWIGVSLVFLSLLMQLFLILSKKTNKNKQFYYLLSIQVIIIFSSIFWIIYAFNGQTIYWQTGVSNIIINIFTTIFFILNIKKVRKMKNTNK